MSKPQHPTSDEVDHLLVNAQLRDQLEPFLDESVDLLDMRRLPTPLENEFLASMLAWEQAPVLPIGKWFYDVELVRLSDTYVRRIAKGRAQVVGEVTR